MVFGLDLLELDGDGLSAADSAPCRRFDPLLAAGVFAGGALSGSCLRPVAFDFDADSRLACQADDGRIFSWDMTTPDATSESLSIRNGLWRDSEEEELGMLGMFLSRSMLGETVSTSGKAACGVIGKLCLGEAGRKACGMGPGL